MIRALEHSDEHAGLSRLAASHGRIPIFAVSASLVERERGDYVGAGFDGWILKPIDFKRLNTLLLGIINDHTRAGCLYVPGEWERGGWFGSRMSPEKKHKAAATLPLGTEQSRSREIGAAENASGEQSS
jgi:CheY-like chemotaxis protein